MVPLAGIEPALLAELDFESSASTSSATGARHRREIRITDAGVSVNAVAARVFPRGTGFDAPERKLQDAKKPRSHERDRVQFPRLRWREPLPNGRSRLFPQDRRGRAGDEQRRRETTRRETGERHAARGQVIGEPRLENKRRANGDRDGVARLGHQAIVQPPAKLGPRSSRFAPGRGFIRTRARRARACERFRGSAR